MTFVENILSGLVLAGIGAVFVVVAEWILSRAAQSNLRALAVRYKGRFRSHGVFGPHEVWFSRRQTAVQVADPGWSASAAERGRTHIGFVHPRADPVRFHLRLRPWTSRLLLRMRNLAGSPLVADPEFERRFLIEGDAAQVAGVFHEGVRGAIMRLHELCGQGDLRIESDASGLFVSTPVKARRAADLNAVVDAACRLFDVLDGAIEGAVPEGSLKIVEAITRVPGVGDGENLAHCPVCGMADGGQWVICRQCATPHHGECWSYNEGCAVFACRGTRSRRAG